MYRKQTGKPLEYVFREERGKSSPLTFLYTRPTAEIVARFKNAIVGGQYSQNGDEKVHVSTQITTGTAKLALVADCVTGWTGYADDRDQPIVFSREQLMAFEPSLIEEFIEVLDGMIYPTKGEQKNSVRPSGEGSPAGPVVSSHGQHNS